MGRFLSRDPIGIWGDAGNYGNGYGYAGNNPCMFVDPSGLRGDWDTLITKHPTDPNKKVCSWGGKSTEFNPNAGITVSEYCGAIKDAVKDLTGLDGKAGASIISGTPGDCAAFVDSCVEFVKNPTLDNLNTACGDAIGLLPGVCALGTISKATKTLNKATDANKPANRIHNTAQENAGNSQKLTPQPAAGGSASTNSPNAGSGNTRFIGQPDGKLVDTKATPKGTYKQPDGSETDVLQDTPHHNKKQKRDDGQSHTHPMEENTAPDGKNYKKRSKDTHPVTTEEAKNIENGKAKIK